MQYGQEYPVLWIKVNKESGYDQLPLSTNSALIVKDSRFALRYDQASSTYTLQVMKWLRFMLFNCVSLINDYIYY